MSSQEFCDLDRRAGRVRPPLCDSAHGVLDELGRLVQDPLDQLTG